MARVLLLSLALCGGAACAQDAPQGFDVGGVCYVDLATAAQADCASYPRTTVTDQVVTTWSCAGSVGVDPSGLAVIVVKRTDTNYTSDQQSYFVNYAPCDAGQRVRDLTTLWGAGLAACAAVWCAKAFVFKLVANQ